MDENPYKAPRDYHYRLRTLMIAGMVLASAIAASASLLDSQWFADLTGWGSIVEGFSRRVAASLVWLPVIFAVADAYVALNVPTERRWKWFGIVAVPAYAVALILCNYALGFANSARE